MTRKYNFSLDDESNDMVHGHESCASRLAKSSPLNMPNDSGRVFAEDQMDIT